MTRIPAICVCVMLLLVAGSTQEQKVFQLAPGVYYWQGDTSIRRPGNCTWVLFKDYVVVIDANFPWGAKEILPEIRKTTSLPIRFVFNTHYHADHSFGSGIFMEAGATIVCSRECGAESRSKGETDWRNQVLNRGERPNASVHDKAVAAETRENGYRLEHPTLLFDGSMAFDDGDRRLELIRMGPGHSLGDAVAYLPKEKILMTGDLCVNWTSGNNVGDRDADHDNWIRALDKMAQWDVKTVVPGHGRPGPVEILRGQRDYLADMLDQVRAGIRASKTIDELAREVDLSRHQPFGFASSANSVRAIYRKLTAPPQSRE
jgi:glyoxylase-like metal-dependent hydrolase (beta-lactamase superfamily II)